MPVIYLVEPTAANLTIVTSDLARSLYSPAYVNFLSSIPRPLLEDFATQTATSGTAEHIAQVYDQYLNFIVSEPDLFSLNMPGAYSTLNSAQTSDEALDALVDSIVSGLFSVAVTMGTIPIIRCPRAGAAELISTKLDRKLRDHFLNSKTSLFGDQKSSGAVASRPVLIIADRNVDLTPMFSHSFSYQGLVSDLLHMHLNKITISIPVDENDSAKGTKKQAYDLTASDSFWQTNSIRPVQDVTEELESQFRKFDEESKEITRKTGASSLDDIQGASIAAHLKGALALLPELKERKALLTMHMNILTAIMKGIGERNIHQFYREEQEILKQTKAQVLDIIKSPDMGTEPLDKLRFFLQWYLTTESDVSRADLESFTQALQTAGADTTAINYVKVRSRKKSFASCLYLIMHRPFASSRG